MNFNESLRDFKKRKKKENDFGTPTDRLYPRKSIPGLK